MTKRSQGFSLLEVLVAFAILGISLGVVFQIFSTGLRAAKLSEEYTQATVLAESKLASIGVLTPYKEGVEEGTFNDKYAWRTTILLYEEPEGATVVPYGTGEGVVAEEPKPEEELEVILNLPVSPYQVIIEVLWEEADKERSVVLKTLRLGPKTAALAPN